MTIQDRLFELQDKEYGKFHASLLPNINPETIIGIRVPQMRKLEKNIRNEEIAVKFLNTLPHDYYDENLLHSILISNISDYNECINKLESFLPYINNWAVCDTLSPKIFKKHRVGLIEKIKEWTKSDKVYTCRFGVDMLMTHFLDEDFREEYLEIPAIIRIEDYYVKMAVAWFFATALAKQWDATLPYLMNNVLDKWTHNKTISKACESYRITPEQKVFLKTLKAR